MQMRLVGSTRGKPYLGPVAGIRVIGVERMVNNKPTGQILAPTTADFSSLSFGEQCSQMAQEIIAEIALYRDRRTTLLGTLRDIAVDSFGFELGRYTLHGTTPTGAGIFATLEGYFANKQYEQTKLDIMRAIYTGSGCGTISWVGGGGGGEAMSGLTASCSYQTWGISRDGGETWREVTVFTCVYQ
jgi:hypothetical protein